MKILSRPLAETSVTGDRPENELLLCCARTCIDSERAQRLKLLQKDIDWAYVIRVASRNRVMPLLYWSLNTTCPEAVPQTTLDQLRNHFHANARSNLVLTRELLRLLNLFEAHKIPALSLKGPILAASAFGNLALRQFGDLDIIVHEQNIPRAEHLLISQGYKQASQLTSAEEANYDQFESGEYYFVHSDGRTVVDLHWEIAPSYFPFPLDLDRLWKRLEPVSLAGTMVPNLPLEDLLLFLCMHGSKHLWTRLAWICDIAELIRSHPGIDWERLTEYASTLRSQRMLFLGLFLANDLLGTALPQDILQKIQVDPVVKDLAVQVRKWLFSEADGSEPLGQVEGFIFYIKMREHLQDRIKHFLYLMKRSNWLIPSKRDQNFLPLPAFLSFLYYLVRPIRVVRKYGLNSLNHLLGY